MRWSSPIFLRGSYAQEEVRVPTHTMHESSNTGQPAYLRCRRFHSHAHAATPLLAELGHVLGSCEAWSLFGRLEQVELVAQPAEGEDQLSIFLLIVSLGRSPSDVSSRNGGA